uniref:receptor-like protein kinase FERONIA n=1 Tax=Erigeron canadensis TaxID=72917 RepID=UPI001CB93909|nr:receptor-like protein kinase FERONIA [Erigeron canadensis]
MFAFGLPLFFSLLLLIFTTAQPYKATEHFLLDCGSSSFSISNSNQRWEGDESSKFVPSDFTTTSFSLKASSQDPSDVDAIPYSTARIFNTSSFTYTFPVSPGPKFLRLHFYPTNYSNLDTKTSFFSVSSNGYSLLTNFSALLHVLFQKETRPDAKLVKEFLIHVNNTQTLNVVFTPSPNSYAFINGIEIVSMPDDLYFNNPIKPKPIGVINGPVIDNNTALENIYRLNMGGGQISGKYDTGMYRFWDQDDNYIYGGAFGLTPYPYQAPITYTTETPNYTAPEQVYQTQRSMGKLADQYNLTWRLPVDSGFNYMLRLHFCNIIPQYTKREQVRFYIFIKNQTVEKDFDPFYGTQGRGYPFFKDYVVHVDSPDGRPSKQDLWLALHPNAYSEAYYDGYLNGLEAFKLSWIGNLAGPNPEPSSTSPPASPSNKSKNKTPYAVIIGGAVGALVLLSILILIVLRRRRQVKHYGTAADDMSSYGPAYSESKSTKSTHSTLPSDRCRRFSLREVKVATDEFNDNCVIGNGGFGKVYKGHIDNATSTVAIKRLNESSSQGLNEFHTEIVMLSKLRHVQLVSLIGYCDDEEEMILVYDYMANGTLREHLYKTNKPPLPWKRRLRICIGAAKGLHYLHTGAKRSIIHRDVKSTNILLDENWVAKVSDFGLSKLGPRDQAQNHVSTVVKGSMGYVDPEYYRTQQLTDKSDVYSFGVVLLEVLCARPVMIPGLPKEQVSLAVYGKSCYQKGTLKQIVDPKLRGKIAPECLRKFGGVATSCLKDNGSDRPTMDEVVWGLEFALELQEAAERRVSETVPENQELPFLMQGEVTTTDDELFSGSTAVRNGTSSLSSSYEGFKSETVFSEILKPEGR